MINGKRNKIIVGVLAVIGLFALLGDNIFRVITILTAVLLFYTSAKLLRNQSSRVMVLSGIAMLVLGSFVLTGWLPMYLLIAIIIGVAVVFVKRYLDK
ncbi:hypothetical protein D7Z54_26400 [Salibacterium salarium]|uniref:Uncharacterized protein n=1 Tax=Salibacterium salarium TaxID=284579 RepID=A0A428MW06_9BACI|nr:hypothetical protein [Salibacterium salarium]RSL30373.1 hypothetical protein D7Z54_26400 [Salibacterium salarium]